MRSKLQYKINPKDGSKKYDLSGIVPQNGNMSKVDRYSWNKPVKKPHFEMVDKKNLKLSPMTQRDVIVVNTLIDIRRNLNWSKFSVLDVSKHKDGTYWVADGQHRLLAVMMRNDVTEVPCMVTETDGIKEDADIFIGKNLHSTKVMVQDKHRVKANAEVPAAVFVDQVFAKYNIPTTKAVNLIYEGENAYEKGEAAQAIYEYAVSLISKLTPDKSYSTAVLKGFMYIAKNCEIPDGDKLDTALAKVTHASLLNACLLAKEKYGRSNNQSGEHNAIEMLKIINKHLKGQNKLYFKPENEVHPVSPFVASGVI